MKKILFKELTIYCVVLLAMAYGMHGAELPDRMNRILENPTLFSHSLIYAFVGYLVLLIPRLFIRVFRKIITKK